MADIYYFDFSKKGLDILGTKDVPVVTNEQAVKEGVINLLYTEVGTRPLHPDYGLDLNKYLFEPLDDITADLMEYEIKLGLEKFEPRINNVEVTIEPDEENSSFMIYVSFNIVYSGSKESIALDFKKIR